MKATYMREEFAALRDTVAAAAASLDVEIVRLENDLAERRRDRAAKATSWSRMFGDDTWSDVPLQIAITVKRDKADLLGKLQKQLRFAVESKATVLSLSDSELNVVRRYSAESAA